MASSCEVSTLEVVRPDRIDEVRKVIHDLGTGFQFPPAHAMTTPDLLEMVHPCRVFNRCRTAVTGLVHNKIVTPSAPSEQIDENTTGIFCSDCAEGGWGIFFFTPPVQSLEYRISFIEAEGREIYLCTSIYLKKQTKKQGNVVVWRG